MKLLKQTFYYGFILIVFALGMLLLLVQGNILTGYELRIVQSGSMEPTIDTGSLIVVQAQERYATNDIVTFNIGRDSGVPTTHRIIDEGLQSGRLTYTTQGDANDSVDPETVQNEDIIGKVVFWVPYLGYLLDFARQPIGFILLIGLPAFLIAVEEISNLWAVWRGRKNDEEIEPTKTSV